MKINENPETVENQGLIYNNAPPFIGQTCLLSRVSRVRVADGSPEETLEPQRFEGFSFVFRW